MADSTVTPGPNEGSEGPTAWDSKWIPLVVPCWRLTSRDKRSSQDLQLLETGKHSDAVIVCGEKTWKVHKAILCQRSDWFAKAFDGSFKEAVDSKITFDKSECDPEKLGWILHYIYGGVINVVDIENEDTGSFQTCIELWYIADYFDLSDLRTYATQIAKARLEWMVQAHRLHKVTLKFESGVTSQILPSLASQGTWYQEWFDKSVRKAYRFELENPFRGYLLSFLSRAGSRCLDTQKVLSLTVEVPAFGEDLVKGLLSHDIQAIIPEAATIDAVWGNPTTVICHSCRRRWDRYDPRLDTSDGEVAYVRFFVDNKDGDRRVYCRDCTQKKLNSFIEFKDDN